MEVGSILEDFQHFKDEKRRRHGLTEKGRRQAQVCCQQTFEGVTLEICCSIKQMRTKDIH